MNQNIGVIFTIRTENLPDNFQEILTHEREVVDRWKQEGILEHLFLRPTRNGAMLIFKDMEEEKARQLIESLPLFPFIISIDYLPLLKQF
jgi:hypothetical protein